MKVFITGGTGTFGQAFARHGKSLISDLEVVCYSRDDIKHYYLKEENPQLPLQCIIGDVKDSRSLDAAIRQTQPDVIIHAAALKMVPVSEVQPEEYIATNVLGSANVARVAAEHGIPALLISTDKACQPANAYGATKMLAERVFASYGLQGALCASTRYGNILSSRGSILPVLQDIADQGKPLPITDMKMSRFWMSPRQMVEFVCSCIPLIGHGQTFVPKIQSMALPDFMRALFGDVEFRSIGLRPGEKLAEELISPNERVVEFDQYFVVMPEAARSFHDYLTSAIGEAGRLLDRGCTYTSAQLQWRIRPSELVKLAAQADG